MFIINKKLLPQYVSTQVSISQNTSQKGFSLSSKQANTDRKACKMLDVPQGCIVRKRKNLCLGQVFLGPPRGCLLFAWLMKFIWTEWFKFFWRLCSSTTGNKYISKLLNISFANGLFSHFFLDQTLNLYFASSIRFSIFGNLFRGC